MFDEEGDFLSNIYPYMYQLSLKISISSPSITSNSLALSLTKLSNPQKMGIFASIKNKVGIFTLIIKQKVVIKVSLNDQKSRTKAIKTAVGVDGVIQAALQQDKDQIEVTGEGIDVVLLATLLRKILKHAEVVSVSAVDDKKEEEKMKKALEAAQKLIWPCTTPVTGNYCPTMIYTWWRKTWFARHVFNKIQR